MEIQYKIKTIPRKVSLMLSPKVCSIELTNGLQASLQVQVTISKFKILKLRQRKRRRSHNSKRVKNLVLKKLQSQFVFQMVSQQRFNKSQLSLKKEDGNELWVTYLNLKTINPMLKLKTKKKNQKARTITHIKTKRTKDKRTGNESSEFYFA